MYAPPERVDSYDFGRSRDIWAFGCAILELTVLLYVQWSSDPYFGALPKVSSCDGMLLVHSANSEMPASTTGTQLPSPTT
jgi:hypothetical protein